MALVAGVLAVGRGDGGGTLVLVLLLLQFLNAAAAAAAAAAVLACTFTVWPGKRWSPSATSKPPPLVLRENHEKEFYLSSARVTISHSYVAVLVRCACSQYRASLCEQGLESMLHLRRDEYYDAVLAGAVGDLFCLPIEDDAHTFSVGLPALRGNALQRGRRGFVLPESFHWGRMSFKFKKPSKSNPHTAQLQVDCPRRSHTTFLESGRKTTCSWTLGFRSEAEKSQVIARLKTWVSDCSKFVTKSEHKRFTPTFAETPDNIELRKPGDVWGETDDDQLPRGDLHKRKRPVRQVASAARRRGRGRGRGAVAALPPAADSKSDSSSSSGSSDTSGTSSNSSLP